MALGARAGRRRLPSSCDVGLPRFACLAVEAALQTVLPNRIACIEKAKNQPTNPVGHLLAQPEVVMCAAAARQLTVAM